MLSGEGRGPAAPREPVESEVLGEVQAMSGLSEGWAGTLIALARRLRDVLPETLAALETGRLDLIRARVLAGPHPAASRRVGGPPDADRADVDHPT
jgi:hypothetical protein